jgi:hypothetical protein
MHHAPFCALAGFSTQMMAANNPTAAKTRRLRARETWKGLDMVISCWKGQDSRGAAENRDQILRLIIPAKREGREMISAGRSGRKRPPGTNDFNTAVACAQ